MASSSQPRRNRDPKNPEASWSWPGSRGARDMAEAPVTSSLGPMGPLLGRLHSLLDADMNLPHRVNKADLRLFTRDLEEVGTSIMELSKAENPNLTDKCWMKEVRELSFDTEDFLDTVLPSGSQVPRKLSSMRTKMKRRKRPLQIANDISELRSRLQEATERRERYQPGVVRTFTPTKKKLVGLDKPMADLVTLLAFDSVRKLMVVSITGFAGVGKTTLATRLYHLYGGRFQCKAYVRVSRNPDTRRLLASLILQLTGSEPRATPHVHNLINNIRDHLKGKSYFIIVDDLWAPSVWDTIRHAFPEGNCCSRIITTTEIEDVALACCGYDSEHTFKLRPLNDSDSWNLFHSMVSASKNDSFDPEFIIDVSNSIVTKSGGLPLAITTVASMLTSWPNKALEQFMYVQDSLYSTMGSNPTSAEMKKVMNLVYNDLPAQLKTCLLYLNIYTEDSVIQKDDLLKQWLAEGFLSAVEQNDIEIVARSYFDELVTRGMIQPVDTNCNDEVLSFTVHHMVLDLIAYECMEENFITVVDCSETIGVPDKVRRLSVKFGGAKNTQIPSRMRISQVRSLTFSGFFRCFPSIVEYQLLRVLILRIWTDEDKKTLDLTSISELNQLRYLKIECSMEVKFPAKIRSLQYLGTLEVNARHASVPRDIVHLQRLLHLRLPAETCLPYRIGYMTSLRSLGYFNLSTNTKHNVLGLGNLTNLCDLRMTYSMERPDRLVSNMKHLAKIVVKMDNLKSLTVEDDSSEKQIHGNSWGDHHGGAFSRLDISRDTLSSLSPGPAALAHLERLELSPRVCTFFGIPDWVSEFSKLCILKIALQNLSAKDVDLLKTLPALASLSLYVSTAPNESVIIQNDGFSVLKHFKFVCPALCLAFVKGAMPSVQRLKLGFNANKIVQHSLLYAGIDHLTSLLEISAEIGGANAYEPHRNAIQSALKEAFNKHKIHPIINVKVVDKTFYVQKEMNTVPQTEVYQTLGELHVITKKGSNGRHITGENDQSKDTDGQPASRTNVPLQTSPEATSSGNSGTREFMVDLSSVVSGLKIVANMLTPLLIKKYSSIPGMTKDLRELCKEVEKINCWLETAGHNELMLNDMPFNLLKQLKEAAYDVEDVVDEFRVKAEKHVAVGGEHIVSKYLSLIPKYFISQLKVAHKIRVIKKRFDSISEQIIEFCAKENSSTVDHPGPLTTKTTANIPSLQSSIDDTSVVGRDEEKDNILSLLQETNDQKRIKIFSIFGSRGVGKTTLAKLVFNDSNIVEKIFDVKLWIHVSQTFEIGKIIEKMFEAIVGENTEHNPLQQMSKTISETLTGRRFLLVLDDVWTEDLHQWEQFMVHLEGAELGSSILLTTCSENVAGAMASAYSFHLPFLTENDSWKMFNRSSGMAVRGSNEFIEIAKDIVKKCDGVPLAVKLLAGVLRDKNRIEDWQAMRDLLGVQIQEHGVIHACLRLSYFYMPSHLRQCFTICAVFPKGYWIDKEQLIDQWIAHDMITAVDGDDYLEDTGEKYFNSLVQMSFLQDANEYKGRVRCRMHDLVRDLAMSILGDEMLLVSQKNDATNSRKSFRYFSLIEESRNLPPENLFTKTRMIYATPAEDLTLGKALQNAKYLRSITVESLYTTSVPTSILHTKYLRYLSISGLKMAILPEVISNIWCMQALHVTNSSFLEGLPKSIGKMCNLRTLNLSGCTVLKNLPDSIGECHMISSLDLSGCYRFEVLTNSIGMNKRLRMLRLGHTKLERLPSTITSLENLEHLDLRWCCYLVELPEGIKYMKKLNVLRPEDLSIGFDGLNPPPPSAAPLIEHVL